MTLRVVANWIWFGLCVVIGLILLKKNLNAPDANLYNWAVVALMFGGAFYFYRRAEQIAPSS